MNWHAVEDALRGWAKAYSGLSDAQVLWAQQTGARPASGTFISLTLGGLVPVAAVDELLSITDLGQPLGQEVEQLAHGVREFSLSVQVFATATVDAVDGGNATARGTLATIQAALRLPSARAALAAVGVSVFDLGSVRNISTVLDTKFEGRAQCDFRFYVEASATERVGYIDKAEVNGETILGGDTMAAGNTFAVLTLLCNGTAAPTIQQRRNIDSVAQGADGEVTVTFGNKAKNANYALILELQNVGGASHAPVPTEKSVSGFKFKVEDEQAFTFDTRALLSGVQIAAIVAQE